ncbi:Hypothetical_protein [Hexamita inflata]|uniref:Hypothetical_protein n=1 Tax=Hexamita inflata TaxID=28002 RepID=A0AA86QFJ0_9EUKA|nr:Hypothetical protein HINF_LOCUS39877 [Hexamita inflata]
MEMQTTVVSGIVQSSQNINLTRCFCNYSVITESGSVICQQFQNIKLQMYTINGSFQSQSPLYLVQDNEISDSIKLDEVTSSFFIKSICKNEFCQIKGNMKTGPEKPKYDKTQLLIGNYNIDKQITVDGVAIGINCIIDGNYDYNATYVILNENIEVSSQRVSLFCFKPTLSKIDVIGLYQQLKSNKTSFTIHCFILRLIYKYQQTNATQISLQKTTNSRISAYFQLNNCFSKYAVEDQLS